MKKRVLLMSGVFCGMLLAGCKGDSDNNPPTATEEILNITGFWAYDATFATPESSYYLGKIPFQPAAPGIPLSLTNSENIFTGTYGRSFLQRCGGRTVAFCLSPIQNFSGGSVSGSINEHKAVTFIFRDNRFGEIQHSGLVNIIETDLPAGTPIRMTMDGTAKMTLAPVGEINGFWHAERILYNPKVTSVSRAK